MQKAALLWGHLEGFAHFLGVSGVSIEHCLARAATRFPPAAPKGWAGKGGGLGNVPPPGTEAWLFRLTPTT